MPRHGLRGCRIQQTMGKFRRTQLLAVRRIYSCQNQGGTHHLFHGRRLLLPSSRGTLGSLAPNDCLNILSKIRCPFSILKEEISSLNGPAGGISASKLSAFTFITPLLGVVAAISSCMAP